MNETDPFLPFAIVHQWTEGEKAKDKGRLPQCDLAFRMLNGNIRSHFTIEAKVILTQGAVSEYVREIMENFLTYRYSTYSTEAAMLGYLLSGCPEITFEAIAESLQCKLILCAPFKNRNHRYSNHQREKGEGSLNHGEKTHFRCHHLLMKFLNRSVTDG